MEQKVVKFEIGKVLAIVIGVVVIAGVASTFLSSNYFKGSLTYDTSGRVIASEGAITDAEEDALGIDCNYLTQEEIREALESEYLLPHEKTILEHCVIIEANIGEINPSDFINTAETADPIEFDPDKINTSTDAADPIEINLNADDITKTVDRTNKDSAEYSIDPITDTTAEKETTVDFDPDALKVVESSSTDPDDTP